MEQQTVSETLRHLAKLLRAHEKDDGLRLESGIEEAGTKPGDNYMSHVVRTRLIGKRGNGTLYANTVMTKRLPDDRVNMDLMRTRDLFANEAHVYTRIVPRLGLEFVAPKCFEANANSLVMEDLRLSGYTMNERRKLMDFQHCEATLKALSRLHALSLTFKLRDPLEFEGLMAPLREPVFPQDEGPSLGRTIGSALDCGIRSLESLKNSGPEILRAIEFLRGQSASSYETMKRLVARRDEKYDVMTHGDSWNNNIFFKYESDGRIASVKFVDFQCARHSSPAIDFHYLVYTSVRANVIEENYHDLVRIYRVSLDGELKKLGASERTLRDLSPEWFEAELQKTSMYGMLMGLWVMNALLAEGDDIPDMNAITPEVLDGSAVHERELHDDQVARTKTIVLHYCRTYEKFNLTPRQTPLTRIPD